MYVSSGSNLNFSQLSFSQNAPTSTTVSANMHEVHGTAVSEPP